MTRVELSPQSLGMPIEDAFVYLIAQGLPAVVFHNGEPAKLDFEVLMSKGKIRYPRYSLGLLLEALFPDRRVEVYTNGVRVVAMFGSNYFVGEGHWHGRDLLVIEGSRSRVNAIINNVRTRKSISHYTNVVKISMELPIRARNRAVFCELLRPLDAGHCNSNYTIYEAYEVTYLGPVLRDYLVTVGIEGLVKEKLRYKLAPLKPCECRLEKPNLMYIYKVVRLNES